MTTLNVTYNGISTDYPLEATAQLSDDDIKRVAAEIAELPPNTFELYVVDRMERHVYLRPKVPFGVPQAALIGLSCELNPAALLGLSCEHPHMKECHPGCGHFECPDCGLTWDDGAER